MRIIIIGSGAAAVEAALKVREYDETAVIELYSNEDIQPYRRPLLPGMLIAKDIPDRFFLHTRDFYDSKNIKINLGSSVKLVDPELQRICLSDQTHVEYDRLLIAAGAACRKLTGSLPPDDTPLPGLRDYTDLTALKKLLANATHVTLIGGGILSLETADILINAGYQVTILERSPALLAGSTDIKSAELIQKLLEQTPGLQLLTEKEFISFDRSEKVLLYKEKYHPKCRSLKTDLVINTAGITPRRLPFTGASNGIPLEVDEFMQVKGCNNIYAAGDCAESPLLQRGSYSCAIYSGRTAASNMCGIKQKAVPVIREVRASFMDITLQSIGDISDIDAADISLKQHKKSLQKLFYRKDKLVGCTLINDNTNSSRYYQAISTNCEDYF